MPPRPAHVKLSSHGYSVLWPKSERWDLLRALHTDLTQREKDEIIQDAVEGSLLNLARLNRSKNPVHAERYRVDAAFVADGYRGQVLDGDDDDDDLHPRPKPRAPKAAKNPKAKKAKLVQIEDDDDNDVDAIRRRNAGSHFEHGRGHGSAEPREEEQP